MSIRDEARLYDVRTLERNLRKGLVARKDYEKYVKSLPDAADKATTCNPEAQGREYDRPAPAPRPRVTATPPPPGDESDEMDDDFDDDELDDEEEEEEGDEA